MDTKIFSLVLLMLLTFLVLLSGCSNQNNVVVSSDSQDNTKGGQSSTIISSQNSDSNSASSLVTIKNFAFIPETLTIKTGTKVKWVNQDSATHTIKSETVNSPSIGNGGFFEFKFDTPGTYEYVCGIHSSMKGRIIVK